MWWITLVFLTLKLQIFYLISLFLLILFRIFYVCLWVKLTCIFCLFCFLYSSSLGFGSEVMLTSQNDLRNCFPFFPILWKSYLRLELFVPLISGSKQSKIVEVFIFPFGKIFTYILHFFKCCRTLGISYFFFSRSW